MVGADLGLWNRLEPALAYLAPEERAKVREAYRFAEEAHRGQLRRSGEPYITHPVAVAEIVFVVVCATVVGVPIQSSARSQI